MHELVVEVNKISCTFILSTFLDHVMEKANMQYFYIFEKKYKFTKFLDIKTKYIKRFKEK